MSASARRLCQLAALLLALATVIGALGAHVLRPRLSVAQYELLHTALEYQFYQSLGLLGLGLALERWPLRALRASGWLLLWGVLLFCGSLYLMLLGAPRWVGVFTPLGGAAMIGAWCLAAIALGMRAMP